MPRGSSRTSTLSRTRPHATGPTGRTDRGLIDTSVAIDLEHLDRGQLPRVLLVSSLTLAELVLGTVVASSYRDRPRRVARLRRIEAATELLDFDRGCARAYGRVCTVTATSGRKVRDRRAVDLLIASTALAHELPLYTRNSSDLRGLDGLIEIVGVP